MNTSSAPSIPAAPTPAPPAPEGTRGWVIIRVGPWAMPLTDQQRTYLDRIVARARERRIPACSIVDDVRKECVVWTMEPAFLDYAASAPHAPAPAQETRS